MSYIIKFILPAFIALITFIAPNICAQTPQMSLDAVAKMINDGYGPKSNKSVKAENGNLVLTSAQ